MNKTYYSVLEIEETVTQDEIQRAFRLLAKKYHPDNIQTGDIQKFKEVMEAYDVLSDLGKRKRYDSSLRENSTTSDSKGTASQTTGKTNSYSQYASYTKTREESKYDLDKLMKYILRKYRKIQEFSEKENFIAFNKSYYNYLKHFQSNPKYEENITLKKTHKR